MTASKRRDMKREGNGLNRWQRIGCWEVLRILNQFCKKCLYATSKGRQKIKNTVKILDCLNGMKDNVLNQNIIR